MLSSCRYRFARGSISAGEVKVTPKLQVQSKSHCNGHVLAETPHMPAVAGLLQLVSFLLQPRPVSWGIRMNVLAGFQACMYLTQQRALT